VRADITPDNVLRDDIPVECDSRHGEKQPDQTSKPTVLSQQM